MAATSTLRAITRRLNSTPVEGLPQHAGHLATSLAGCAALLREPAHKDSEKAIQIQKLRTRLSSLLQDRTTEGRFTGVVLVKTFIEVGDVAVLADSASWVRSLLSCLNKPDPPEVKRLCLLTIARIFLLTRANPSLVREITTPCLPTFISTCLSLIKPSGGQNGETNLRVLSPLLLPVLKSWYQLMLRFPSTFRPHVPSIRAICLSLLSDASCPATIVTSASRLVSRLHFCAPKNAAASEWVQLCNQTIDATHNAADHVFRSVMEDWVSSISRTSRLEGKRKTATEISHPNPDELGLDAWTGVATGCNRIVVLLDLLRRVLTGQHAQSVSLPLGSVMNLCARFTSVTLPTAKFTLRSNPEVGRDEREELWLYLPNIHTAVIDLFNALVRTFGQALMPIVRPIALQLWDVFEAEADNRQIRTAFYQFMTELLARRAFGVAKEDYETLNGMLRYCCADLLHEAGVETTNKHGPQFKSQKSTDLSLAPVQPDTQNIKSEFGSRSKLSEAAWKLLPVVFTNIPLHLFPRSVRTELDRTAILLNHHEAILASTLNPPQSRHASKTSTPSLLLFLAASDIESLSKEALLRPRMPPVLSGQTMRFTNSHTDEAFEHEEESRANTADIEMTTGDEAPNHVLPQKRDFASIVEQSADEQLQASSSLLGAEGIDSTKRQRTDIEMNEQSALQFTRATQNTSAVPTYSTEPVNLAMDTRTTNTPHPTTNNLGQNPVFPSYPATDASTPFPDQFNSDTEPRNQTSAFSNPINQIHEPASSEYQTKDEDEIKGKEKEAPIPQNPSSAFVPPPKAKLAGAGNESESESESDFEIPVIDTTMSTDDEDEE